MTPQESIDVVRAYYSAYHAGSQAATMSALEGLLDPAFVLESPLVQEKFGSGLTGASALSAAAGAARLLEHAEIDSLYVSLSGDGVASLISFPSPVGTIVQSEHFDINQDTGRITRLRSFYDPRKLLAIG